MTKRWVNLQDLAELRGCSASMLRRERELLPCWGLYEDPRLRAWTLKAALEWVKRPLYQIKEEWEDLPVWKKLEIREGIRKRAPAGALIRNQASKEYHSKGGKASPGKKQIQGKKGAGVPVRAQESGKSLHPEAH